MRLPDRREILERDEPRPDGFVSALVSPGASPEPGKAAEALSWLIEDIEPDSFVWRGERQIEGGAWRLGRNFTCGASHNEPFCNI